MLIYNSLEINEPTEDSHKKADKLLIKFIDDPEIKKAYELIPKWHA